VHIAFSASIEYVAVLQAGAFGTTRQSQGVFLKAMERIDALKGIYTATS
jgi:hypothetical protein